LLKEMGRVPTLERWLLAAAAICVGAVVARCLGLISPVLPQVWDKAYNGAEFCAITVIVLRALRARGGERAAWAVLALGLLGYAAADVYYLVALRDLAEAPYPSPADAGYLSIFPATFVALVLLVRARAPRLSSKLWLDGLICALAAGAVGSTVVLPLTASTEGSLAAVATNVAYPLGDCLILAFVASVMASRCLPCSLSACARPASARDERASRRADDSILETSEKWRQSAVSSNVAAASRFV